MAAVNVDFSSNTVQFEQTIVTLHNDQQDTSDKLKLKAPLCTFSHAYVHNINSNTFCVLVKLLSNESTDQKVAVLKARLSVSKVFVCIFGSMCCGSESGVVILSSVQVQRGPCFIL